MAIIHRLLTRLQTGGAGLRHGLGLRLRRLHQCLHRLLRRTPLSAGLIASGLAATALSTGLASLSGLTGLSRLIAGLLTGLASLITGLPRLFSSLLTGLAGLTRLTGRFTRAVGPVKTLRLIHGRIQTVQRAGQPLRFSFRRLPRFAGSISFARALSFALTGLAAFLTGLAAFLAGLAAFLAGLAAFLAGFAAFLAGLAAFLAEFAAAAAGFVGLTGFCVFPQ